jgi:hypothetical protein
LWGNDELVGHILQYNVFIKPDVNDRCGKVQ